MNSKRLYLGIDIGSVSVKYAVLGYPCEIIETGYTRHFGEPFTVLKKKLDELGSRYPLCLSSKPSFTGTGGKLASRLLDGFFINEVISNYEAVKALYPNTRTVIEVGGEDSKLITLKKNGESGIPALDDFALNTMCSAGTGSFLDQQANRLGVRIEDEFGAMALKSTSPPHIAGRCSVFAKSDMIHLQQAGAPVHDIAGGLCFALARSFKSSLVMGKRIGKPVLFQGGVAANKGMLKAFETVFNLGEGELEVPKHYKCMGAIGSVLASGQAKKLSDLPYLFPGFKRLEQYMKSAGEVLSSIEPLSHKDNGHRPDITIKHICPDSPKMEDAYIGIDIGSLSTNVVVIDKGMEVIARSYVRTAGRPLEAVKQALLAAGSETGNRTVIRGAATTGSGRYMVGEYIGADLVKNEITTQALAAIHFFPDVDTVFEIGGQDSKYISIKNGIVVDFEMNKVCAAGTGSFIEEQAEKLGLNIENQFANFAFNSKKPGKFGNRCTVFIESDIVSHQQRGAEKEDIVSGLAFSIAENYLNRVVAGRKVGENILFQGGVAWNSAVVAAFSRATGKKINVPPHHDVTGALGAALLAKKNHEDNRIHTSFKGFDLGNIKYETTNLECRSCANVCNIIRIKFSDRSTHVHGARCEKYEKGEKTKKAISLPDLFSERERMIFGDKPSAASPASTLAGIPRVLYMHQQFPFWKTFLNEIEVPFIISEWSNREIISSSSDNQAAETCLPVKIVQGHIMDLLSKGVTHILFPSVIAFGSRIAGVKSSCTCPMVQTAPQIAEAAISHELSKRSVILVSPEADFSPDSEKLLRRELTKACIGLGGNRRKTGSATEKAFHAQSEYEKAAVERGAEILSLIEQRKVRGVAILSRPYNGCDRGLNFNLPGKLREMGIVAIPPDFLPYDRTTPLKHTNMYWKSGQEFLQASDFLAGRAELPAIHLSNFKCGPDSFTSHFLRRTLANHPMLELELDEHNADAGFVTRCEAFFDSIEA